MKNYLNFYLSGDSLFDFVTFKEIGGWEYDDNPWEEQMSRKKGHPLFSKRWAPKENNFICLILPDAELTVNQVIKLQSISDEGGLAYRIEKIQEYHATTSDALKSNNQEAVRESANLTFDGSTEVRIDQWDKKVKDWISQNKYNMTALKGVVKAKLGYS